MNDCMTIRSHWGLSVAMEVTVFAGNRYPCLCSTLFDQILFDVFPGRFHTVLVAFCSMVDDPCTLLRFGYWAASPKQPVLAFSVELLTRLNMLTLECAVSVQGFVHSLRWLNSWTAQEVSGHFSE